MFRSPSRRPVASFRPVVEGLEARTLLDVATLDPTFGTGGKVVTDFVGPRDNPARAAVLQPDGKIVVVGSSSSLSGSDFASPLGDFAVARFQADGSLDTTFGIGGRVQTDFDNASDQATDVALQTDGKLLVTGTLSEGRSGIGLVRYNADGSLDTTFGAGGRVRGTLTTFALASAAAIAVQPDGKILTATVELARGSAFMVFRYHADGTPDASFGSAGRAQVSFTDRFGFGRYACRLLLRPDGRIILATSSRLVGLLPNGSHDGTFGQADPDLFSDFGSNLGAALQADGKIVLAGTSSSAGPSARDVVVVRFNPDGRADASFGAMGRVHTDFGGNDVAAAVAVTADGKLLVGGHTAPPNNPTFGLDFALARYNPNGSLDTTFGVGGKVITELGSPSDAVRSVLVRPDGKLVAAGNTFGRSTEFGLVRYSPDGTLDTAFGLGGRASTSFVGSLVDVPRAVAVQPDGKIIVVGSSQNNPSRDLSVVRYLPTGVLDSSFGAGGRVLTGIDHFTAAYGVTFQPDGKIVVAGTTGTAFAAVRYAPDGSLDAGFGDGGKVRVPFLDARLPGNVIANSVAVQPDGKVVLAGQCGVGTALARLNPNGSLDPTFGSGGRVGICGLATATELHTSGIAFQPGGKIVVGLVLPWEGGGPRLRRYNADGSVDTTFGVGGESHATIGRIGVGFVAQPDGKLVVSGSTVFGSTMALARYHANGLPDTSFGDGGRVIVTLSGYTTDTGLVRQPDGKLVIVGTVLNVSGQPHRQFVTLTRFHPTGRLDTTFGTFQVREQFQPTGRPHAAVQPDGKIVVADMVSNAATGLDFVVTRVTAGDQLTGAGQRYVSHAYQSLLDRPPTADELARWSGPLDSGQVTRAEIVNALIDTVDYRRAVVRKQYRALLNRDADAAGLNAFTEALTSGSSVAQVRAAILASPEYYQTQAGGTDAGFITALYLHALGRPPDAAGRAAFGAQLAAGQSRGAVALFVVTSEEGTRRVVDTFYRQYLGRGGEPSGMEAFTAFLRAGGREDVAVAVFVASAEFVAGV